MNGCTKIAVCLITLLLLTVSSSNVCARTLFFDEFSREKGLVNWNVIEGKWSVVERGGVNGLFIDAGGKHPHGYTLINIKHRNFSNFALEIRLRSTTNYGMFRIYMRNDHGRNFRVSHNGYWVGISGNHRAVSWGWFTNGRRFFGSSKVAKKSHVQYVRLRLEIRRSRLNVWLKREKLDKDYIEVYNINTIDRASNMKIREGALGFLVSSGIFIVDKITVTNGVEWLGVIPKNNMVTIWSAIKSFDKTIH